MFELGNTLREARHRRQIDLVIAEQDTKIRSKYLAALESEDFDVLPGPVFVRGFLRTYSFYLGLDSQLFIDEYNERFGRFEDVEEQQSGGSVLGRTPGGVEHASRRRRTLRYTVIVALVAIAIFAWMGLRNADDDSARTATTSVDSSPSTSTDDAADTEDSAGESSGDMRDAVDAAREPVTSSQ